MFKAKAKILFDPKPLSGAIEKMVKPFWVIAVVDGQHGKDLGDYYRFLLEKRFGLHIQNSITSKEEIVTKHHMGLKLQLPAWGTHISIIRGEPTEQKKWDIFKAQYNEKIVDFEYDISPKTSGLHWWLKVKCEEFLDLRELMGYKRNPEWSLHLTLGSPTPLYEEKSTYIHYLYKEGLIDSNN